MLCTFQISWVANFVSPLPGLEIQIIIKECHNEDAQCAFIIDKILEHASNGPASICSYGSIAILYRRQVNLNFHIVHKIKRETSAKELLLHLYYRCQGRSSKQLFARGKYHLTFMVWPSTGKRSDILLKCFLCHPY